MIHSCGCGQSNREASELLSNGKYYQNAKGEYVVDLILFSHTIDIRKALIREKKILDLKPVELEEADFVWINLVGYDRLIKYAY